MHVDAMTSNFDTAHGAPNIADDVDVDGVNAEWTKGSALVALTTNPVADVLASCREYPVLSRDEERTLFQRLEAGDKDAVVTLIASNVRLVAKHAFARRVDGYSVEDIFQDGMIGLLTAIRKFDWRRGLKLSTYATWWIRQSIERGIDDRSRTIRVPVHACDAVRAAQRTTHTLAAALGREPTTDEVDAALPGTVRTAVAYERSTRIALSLDADDLVVTRRGHQQQLQLETSTASVEDGVLAAELVREVDQALSCLRPVERRVLTLHRGLAGEVACSFEDIARRLGCSRARAGQIATRALAKVAAEAHRSGLSAFA